MKIKKNNSLYKFLVTLLLIFVYLVGSNAAVCAAPHVSSNYYCLMEGKTGQVLLAKNQDEKRQVASTTKVMTAVITLEYADLNDVATISKNADHTPEYTIGLKEGQSLTVAELLKIALIRSANDAAVVLAEHVTGDERLFAHLMSKKAFAIGAVNTHFENSSGLPANNSYSTAYDMAQISRYALTIDYIAKMVSTVRTTFDHPGYRKPLTITNTNGLLQGFRGADGIKTGTTNAAGRCLLASATRNDRQLIAAVLKSGNRQGDCARLLEHGYTNYTLVNIIDDETPFKTLGIADNNTPKLDLYPARPIFLWYDGEHPSIEKKVVLDYEIVLPVKKGQQLGTIMVYVNGKYFDSTELVSGQTIKKGFWQRLLNKKS